MLNVNSSTRNQGRNDHRDGDGDGVSVRQTEAVETLGFPTISFGFFHHILWKNWSELIGQPSRTRHEWCSQGSSVQSIIWRETPASSLVESGHKRQTLTLG